MSGRFAGVLAAMAALLGAGLATGTRVYYALCILLALMILYALASILWMLATVRVSMKGVRPRVARGERLMTILTVEHRSVLPVGALRIGLNVPGGAGGRQEIRADVPPFVKRNFRNVIRCPHRGSYEVGVTKLTACDLFGLFEFSRKSGKKLLRAAQACALLAGRDYVAPEDVQRMAEPVLAHRLVLSPEARMRNMTPERVLQGLLSGVQVPVKVK